MTTLEEFQPVAEVIADERARVAIGKAAHMHVIAMRCR